MAGYNLIPNMEQMNPEYANSTQYTKTGGKTYAVTYGPNGEYQARTLVPDYDYNLGVDRAALGGSPYDQFFMTNTELGQIADARRAAENGTGTWEEANRIAESIRGAYGYSGGADGRGYTPTGSKNVYSGVSSVRDPATLLSLSGADEQRQANWLIGNYGNDYTGMVDGKVQTVKGTGTPAGYGGYDAFLEKARNAGLLGQFDETDLAYAQLNPNYGNALLQTKMNWNNATTPEQRALAEIEAASLRENMGVKTGITKENMIYALPDLGKTYAGYDLGTKQLQGAAAPGLGSGLGSGGTLGDIAGYNYGQFKASPDYGELMDSWANNGRLAMQGTLSQASARTGGLASSYAEGAAQQMYQQYMTEAEQEAYDRYRDALNDLYNLYSLQTDQEETMYQREMDALDRAQAQADADYENQLTMAQLAAQYGDYSGLAALGIDTSALTDYTVTGGSGGSGSSGRSGDSGSDSGGLPSESIAALRGAYPDGVIPLSDWNEILSGNANITEADLIAAGFTSGGDTAGYNSNRFDAAMSSMNTALRQGRTDGALQGLESIWNKLNAEQKARAQKLLEKYGLWYEV